ncbi:MAG: hypothetical protein IH934_05355 [Nanoarchaeota archaeon]|nr:hypothetical protein [Nanoarchaeota archaeon]
MSFSRIEYTDIGEKPYVLSKFIFPSHHPWIDELKVRGQVAIVPRLLAAYTMEIRDTSDILEGRLDCDINRGQFLIDDNDTFYQLDFSRPVERRFSLNDVKRRLVLFGLTADPNNEVVMQQIHKLQQLSLHELYSEFTQRAQQVSPKQTEYYRDMFLWNINNINRLLHSLNIASGETPTYTIVRSQ